MPSLAFYFLTCLMYVATISSRQMPIPATVNHPDYQCKQLGFLGLCLNPRTFNGYVDCKNFDCAAPLRGLAQTHRAMPVARAARGAHCGENKICYDGDCIDLPRGINMPREMFKINVTDLYFCHRPNSVQVRSG